MSAHVDERLSEGLVDQKAAESSAVDMEIRGEPALPGGVDRRDVAAVVEPDVLDLVQDVDHAARGRPAPEKVGHEVRVEVPGMRHGAAAVEELRRLLRIHERRLAKARVVDRLS